MSCFDEAIVVADTASRNASRSRTNASYFACSCASSSLLFDDLLLLSFSFSFTLSLLLTVTETGVTVAVEEGLGATTTVGGVDDVDDAEEDVELVVVDEICTSTRVFGGVGGGTRRASNARCRSNDTYVIIANASGSRRMISFASNNF